MKGFIGITLEAEKFITENVDVLVTDRCPHCDGELVSDSNSVVYDHIVGIYEEEYPLFEYRMGDKVVREVLQESYPHKGSVYFLCLRVGDEEMFRWTEEEMSRYL